MKGRTYRYFEKEPLYPFGHGLSFSHFTYSQIHTDRNVIHADDSVKVTVSIKNNGPYDGEEVLQLYVKKTGTNSNQFPIKSLQGFTRIFIKKNEIRSISFLLRANQLRYYDEASKDYRVATGSYDLSVGSSSSDIRQSIKVTVE
jgi:beta-glucosidase